MSKTESYMWISNEDMLFTVYASYMFTVGDLFVVSLLYLYKCLCILNSQIFSKSQKFR